MNLVNSGQAMQLDSSLSPQSNLHSINSFDTLSSLGSLQPLVLNSSVPNKDVNQISQMNPQDQQNFSQDSSTFESQLISQQIQALLLVKKQHEQQQAQQRAAFDQMLIQLQAQHFVRAYQQQQQQKQQQFLQQNLLLLQLQQQQQLQKQQPQSLQQQSFTNSNNLNINILGGLFENSLLNSIGGNTNNISSSLNPILPGSSSNFFSQFLGASLPFSNNMPSKELNLEDNLKIEGAKSFPIVQSNTQKLSIKRKKTHGNEMELKKKVKIELPKKTSISLETEDLEETINKKSSKEEKLQNSTLSTKTCSSSSITKQEAQEDREEEEDENDEVNTSKDVRSRSKFHNLTKLFLNSLLSIFTKENMDASGIFIAEQEAVTKCISRVKQSGRKTQGKVCKTDLFNHSHYNVLFLKLTPESIIELSSKPKDAAIHKFCFDIDFNEVISQEQINAVNRTKHNIFIITHTILANPANKDSIKHEYWQRAIVGIRQLAQGKLIYRFQSLSKNQQLHQQQNLDNSSIKMEASSIITDNNSPLLSSNLSSQIQTNIANQAINIPIFTV